MRVSGRLGDVVGREEGATGKDCGAGEAHEGEDAYFGGGLACTATSCPGMYGDE